MTRPIDGHGKTPPISGEGKSKEIYSRDLHETIMATKSAADPIKENIPNYRAALQTARSLKNNVTGKPTNKSAGKADHVGEREIFKNRAYLTRVAPYTKHTTPLSASKLQKK